VNVELFDILRCPFCGNRLELVRSVFHRSTDRELEDGVLECQCSWFPVVAGIPVMHLEPPVPVALGHLESGRPDLARHAMFNLTADRAARFEEVVASDRSTYAEVVDALGPNYERGYFLYRFSDPSYIVAHALIRAVAGTVLRDHRRAIDICGGSGHLTRALMDLSSAPPVLADLYFAKVWLGRQFTSPGCEGVCCQADAPLPFRRGAFGYAMCADAFMFMWNKRRLVGELVRLIDGDSARAASQTWRPGAVVISHTHNELQWSESLGQALPPDGYRELFETIEPRLFSEAGLFADVVRGGPLDLGRSDSQAALEADPALTIVATNHREAFRAHALDRASGSPGELRINPLYARDEAGDRVRLRLRFPSPAYEEEFGACREYLPAEAGLTRADLAALATGRLTPALEELARTRVLLDLPKKYY
jgi:uncharacterized protein YbaR (Trm112 family)